MTRKSSEQGIALITAVILLLVLFILGTGLLMLGNTERLMSKSFSTNERALYVAEAGINQIVAMQNDLSRSPPYLVDPNTFQGEGVDPYLVDLQIADPETGEVLGTCTRQIVNDKDPRAAIPPYRIRSVATSVSAIRIVEADIDLIGGLPLLRYAFFGEGDLDIEGGQLVNGWVYAKNNLTLKGAGIVFADSVEYGGNLVNPGNGTFEGLIIHPAAPKKTLAELLDLAMYEDATKKMSVCTGGAIGLYIGADTGNRNAALFQRSSGVYQIDLTLFDFGGAFSTPAHDITYNGVSLTRFNHSQAIKKFNGIIFVDGELHLWGINGGRSVEDQSVLDKDKSVVTTTWYPGPNGAGNNRYSNNQLDAGEDGTNGGTSQDELDYACKGMTISIVTAAGSNIVIDHNIFAGRDATVNRPTTALISGSAIRISATAPKALLVEASLIALGDNAGLSIAVDGDAATHQNAYWARIPAGTYAYDLDRDGTLETDNQKGQAGDRDETAMLAAWSLILYGNLLVKAQVSSGIWSTGGHTMVFEYDAALPSTMPPCFPEIGAYNVVPGSWIEIQ